MRGMIIAILVIAALMLMMGSYWFLLWVQLESSKIDDAEIDKANHDQG